jgi:hypothetical protein
MNYFAPIAFSAIAEYFMLDDSEIVPPCIMHVASSCNDAFDVILLV